MMMVMMFAGFEHKPGVYDLHHRVRLVVPVRLQYWSTQPSRRGTVARCMIGYWHHTVVCLSVRLSVTLCDCGAQGR